MGELDGPETLDLSNAASLPEAIVMLRKAAGSHDKLAARLGTNRQTVIAWEKGSWPKSYVDKLREEGVPEQFLTRSVSREDLDERVRQLEAELAALRQEISRLR